MNQYEEIQQTILGAEGASVWRYDPGAILFWQGDLCRAVAYVASGSIAIKSSSPDGRELTIQEVGCGDFFGDVLTFAGEHHYLGNVVANEPTLICFLAPDAFLALLTASRPLLAAYLAALSRKTFQIKQQVKLLSLPDLRSKILFYLGQYLGPLPAGPVPIPGSKERLASLLCVERPSLSRELAHMKKEGIIDYSRTHIILK
ncbi:MAG: Crp/Fnr family transcriptional regulator [bacterium]